MNNECNIGSSQDHPHPQVREKKLSFRKPDPGAKNVGTPALDYVFLKGRDCFTLIEKLSLEQRKPNKHFKMNSCEV